MGSTMDNPMGSPEDPRTNRTGPATRPSARARNSAGPKRWLRGRFPEGWKHTALYYYYSTAKVKGAAYSCLN